jgi:hypothetical protein
MPLAVTLLGIRRKLLKWSGLHACIHGHEIQLVSLEDHNVLLTLHEAYSLESLARICKPCPWLG